MNSKKDLLDKISQSSDKTTIKIDKKFKTIALNSYNDIAEFYKIFAHPVRIKILIFLSDEPKDFSFFQDEIRISKASLANHINLLIDNGLIERLERGRYRIKADGLNLLKNNYHLFFTLENTKKRTRKQLQLLYAGLYGEQDLNDIEIKTSNITSSKPVYENSWNTFIGSVTGVLKAKGVTCDKYDVAGYSGYCFITNVAKGTICSSADRVLPDSTWELIKTGVESFGYKLYQWKEDSTYSIISRTSSEDLKRAQNLLNHVKSSIDRNIPVIMWGIPKAGYCIVYGYIDNNKYLVSSWRRFEEQQHPLRYELNVRFDEVYWSKQYHYHHFEEEKSIECNELQRDKNAIVRAIKLAKGSKVNIDTIVPRGYISGPEAYDVWIASMHEVEATAVVKFSLAYLIQVYRDAKEASSIFLDRMAQKYRRLPQYKSLEKASQAYRNLSQIYRGLSKFFPYYDQNSIDLSDDIRQKAAQHLREAKIQEIKAIKRLEQALNVWKAVPSLIETRYPVLSKKVISKNPKFMKCWNSFIGSVTGVLKGMDSTNRSITCDTTEVGGRSGCSFLNYFPNKLEPIGNTVLSFGAWCDILFGLRIFGYTLEHMIDYSSENPTLDRSKQLFKNIKQTIDAFDVPVILFGVPNASFSMYGASYSIVKGYTGESYIISSHRSVEGQEESPIRYDEVGRSQYWSEVVPILPEFFYPRDKIDLESESYSLETADKEAIQRIIMFSEGKASSSDNLASDDFITGLNMYKAWKQTLQTVPEQKLKIYILSYLGQLYRESKALAAAFLDRLSKRYLESDATASNLLAKAAKEYRDCEHAFRKYTTLFYFYEQDEIRLNEDTRRRGIETINEAYHHEQAALSTLKDLLKYWDM